MLGACGHGCGLLVALLLAAGSPAQGMTFSFDGALGKDGLPRAWSFKRWAPFVGLGSFEATAKVVERDGRRVLYLKSADAGFFVASERRADVASLRQVSWSWMAEQLPAGGNFAQRATNDQALQLLFGFEGGKVVGYLWDSTAPVGASGSGLTWREDVRVIVLRSGSAQVGRWVEERRNLYEDFKRLFGEEPGALVGLAVQSNSQHTASVGSGWVGAVVLSP